MIPEADKFLLSVFYPVLIVYKTVCCWMLWIFQNNVSAVAMQLTVCHMIHIPRLKMLPILWSEYLYFPIHCFRLLKLWWDTWWRKAFFSHHVTYLPLHNKNQAGHSFSSSHFLLLKFLFYPLKLSPLHKHTQVHSPISHTLIITPTLTYMSIIIDTSFAGKNK